MGKVRSKILYHGAYIGVGCLALLLFAIFACPGFSGASAISSSDFTANDVMANQAEAYTTSNDAGALTQVWIRPTISIALTGTTISIDSKDATNNFATQTTELQVATNSTAGLKVYVHAQDGTDLTSTDVTAGNKIPSILSPSTPADFPAGNSSWGYYVGDVDPTTTPQYQPVRTDATVAKETTTSGTSNKYALGVGVKIDPTTPIGEYRNRLVVSVVANPVAAFNLFSITRMQDMTPEICRDTPNYASTSNYARKQLLDDRGTTKKSYWVAKLADGNCWMQENLKLNLGFEMTSSDTDLASGTKTTILPATTITSGSFSNDSATDSRTDNTRWWYSWNAATAGSGASVTTADSVATDSICPKGWQLPPSGSKYNTLTSGNASKQLGSGSLYDLLISYGISNGTTMRSIGATTPLNFSFTGYAINGTTSALDSHGDFWSSVASSATYAYKVFWDSNNNFGTAYSERRAYGMQLRCVARQKAR